MDDQQIRIAKIADEFDQRAKALRNGLEGVDDNSRLAASRRGRARSYNDAATTLRSRFKIESEEAPKEVRMRKIVGYEGRETLDKRIIEPGVLSVVDEVIPVTMYGVEVDGVAQSIGKASHFLRTEDGVLSFLLTLTTNIDLSEHNPMMYLSGVNYTIDKDGLHTYTSGTIREISYSRGPNAWGETGV